MRTCIVNYGMGNLGSVHYAVRRLDYDVDISSDTGADTAIGAIFIVRKTADADVMGGVRKNGSTDDFYHELDSHEAHVALVGVDANEVAEMKIATTDVDLYLMGYVTSGAVFFTNAVDKSTATTGSYVDVDITGDIGSDDATGALLETFAIDEVYHSFGVRRNGATDDIYDTFEHAWPIVEIDSNDIFEQKIEDVDRDLYLTGYTIASAGTPGLSVNYRSIGTPRSRQARIPSRAPGGRVSPRMSDRATSS